MITFVHLIIDIRILYFVCIKIEQKTKTKKKACQLGNWFSNVKHIL